ncbi:hypothetical protein Tco_1393346 [Tanacetum coccineum]
MHSIGKTIAKLHAMLKLHENGIPKKAETPAVLAIREGKIQNNKRKPQRVKCKDKGNNKLAYPPKPKIPPPPKRDNPAKDFICHHCKEGLRGIKKLKHGALSLYMGNGMCVAIKAIGNFDLILRNGLVIVLENCLFAPTVTRGVVSTSRLVENVAFSELVPNKMVERIALWKYGTEAPRKQWVTTFTIHPENKIFVARNAEFFENNLIVQEASGSHGLLKLSRSNEGLELIQEEDTQHSKLVMLSYLIIVSNIQDASGSLTLIKMSGSIVGLELIQEEDT